MTRVTTALTDGTKRRGVIVGAARRGIEIEGWDGRHVTVSKKTIVRIDGMPEHSPREEVKP